MTEEQFESYCRYVLSIAPGLAYEGSGLRVHSPIGQSRVLSHTGSELVYFEYNHPAGEITAIADGIDALWKFESDAKSDFFDQMGLEILT